MPLFTREHILKGKFNPLKPQNPVPPDILAAVQDLADYAVKLSKQIESDTKHNQELKNEDKIIRNKIYAIEDLINGIVGRNTVCTTAHLKNNVTLKPIYKSFNDWNKRSAEDIKLSLNDFRMEYCKGIKNLNKKRGWFSETFDIDCSTYRKFQTLENVVINHLNKKFEMAEETQSTDQKSKIPADMLEALQNLAAYAAELSQEIKCGAPTSVNAKENKLIIEKIDLITAIVEGIVGPGYITILNDNYKNNVSVKTIPDNFSHWHIQSATAIQRELTQFKVHNDSEYMKIMNKSRGWFGEKTGMDTTTFKKFKAFEEAVYNNREKGLESNFELPLSYF